MGVVLGLIDLFGRKDKGSNIESVVIGYLRVETSKHLGHSVDSKEFESACNSAAERVETVLLPLLKSDKNPHETVYKTLSSVCTDRINEAFGAYLVLLWVRYCKIQIAIAQGKVKAEEATLTIISEVLNRQIQRLIQTPA